MKITAVGLGTKHELELSADDTIRSVKARLEPLLSLSADELKLVVKGKSPDDSTPIASLGLAEGAKVMLMRSKAGAKSAAKPAVSASTSSLLPPWLEVGCAVDYLDSGGEAHPAIVKAVHTDDPPQFYCTIAFDEGGEERQTPLDRLLPRGEGSRGNKAPDGGGAAVQEAGDGPVALTVSQGSKKCVLHCEGATTVLALKELLKPLVGGEPATMKLLAKGKEAADASTVEALGLGGGGKLMLLFKARHHREQEGAAAVRDCSTQLADLRIRVEKLAHKLTKRLLDGPEAQVQLGALDEELGAIAQDLRNAVPGETSEVASVRTERLAECERISEQLAAARKAEADAQLALQLGR